MKHQTDEGLPPERPEDLPGKTRRKIRLFRLTDLLLKAFFAGAELFITGWLILMLIFMSQLKRNDPADWRLAAAGGACLLVGGLMAYVLRPMREHHMLTEEELAGATEAACLRAVREQYGGKACYRGVRETVVDFAPHSVCLADKLTGDPVKAPETEIRHRIEAERGDCRLLLSDVRAMSSECIGGRGHKSRVCLLDGIYAELRFREPFPWRFELRSVPEARGLFKWEPVFPDRAETVLPSGRRNPEGVGLPWELTEWLKICRVGHLAVHQDGRIEFTVPKGKLLKPGFRDLDDGFDGFRDRSESLLALTDALIGFHREHAAAPDAAPSPAAGKRTPDAPPEEIADQRPVPKKSSPVRRVLRILKGLLFGLTVFGIAHFFGITRNGSLAGGSAAPAALLGALAPALLVAVHIVDRVLRENEQRDARPASAEPYKAVRAKAARQAAAGLLGVLAAAGLIVGIAVPLHNGTELMIMSAIPAVLSAAAWLLASAGRG